VAITADPRQFPPQEALRFTPAEWAMFRLILLHFCKPGKEQELEVLLSSLQTSR
jgi:hypothetical protein